ncbi:MAG: metallophosphoesterase [Saprospiraceae bacterium]|nr:metallophosphoesterase [Saprospiraceae bacterium]
MRILLLFGFLVFLDIYAFQAIRFIGQNWPAWLRTGIFVLYWSVPVIAIGYMLAAQAGVIDNWSKGLVSIVRAFIFIFYLAKFFVAVILLVDDLRRLLFKAYEGIAGPVKFDKGRSRFMAQLALIIGAIPLGSLSYGIIRNRYRYQVRREIVRISGLPLNLKGLKVIQISDIHSGSFTDTEPVRKAVDLINEEEADLVFFTGDLVNYRSEEAMDYVDVFDKIRAKYGVYSVLGNHDYGDYVQWDSPAEKTANMENLYDIHRRLGWQLLRNESALVPVNGHNIGVIGVENYSAHPRFPKYGDLKTAYGQASEADLKILLSHDPSHWMDQVILPEYQDIALTLSGHTHGMQFGIEIPGWIKWSPIKYVYKEWAGLYKEANQYLYVNRGLGYLGYPGRVGILPEITVLELQEA